MERSTTNFDLIQVPGAADLFLKLLLVKELDDIISGCFEEVQRGVDGLHALRVHDVCLKTLTTGVEELYQYVQRLTQTGKIPGLLLLQLTITLSL